MVPEQDATKHLLLKAGLHGCSLDQDGFPLPGVIIRHFREQMKYFDPDEKKEKTWTQVDLARRLKVSEVTVRLMETQNKGLDSLKRRRLLSTILKIPPVLLGLGSLPDLTEYLKHSQNGEIALSSASVALKSGAIEPSTIKLYQDAFLVYSEMHSTATAQDALFDIGQWIGRIKDDTDRAQPSQKPFLYRTLWGFHDLNAKIYSDDLNDWARSFDHLNTALELANLLNDNDLRAASLYRSGQIRFAQRNFTLAKSDLDGAVAYAKNGSPHIKGAIFAAAGLAYALVETDMAGKVTAQRLFDQAEPYASVAGNTDEHIIKFGMGKYLLERADALISLGRPAKALEILDEAESGLDSAQKRRIAYLNILRAECYTKLKRPEYDTALGLLLDAFDASQTIKSGFNIGHIERLHKLLGASSYGTSPAVADLGISLREWRNLK